MTIKLISLLSVLVMTAALSSGCVNGQLHPAVRSAANVLLMTADTALNRLEKAPAVKPEHKAKLKVARDLIALARTLKDGKVTEQEALEAVDRALEIIDLVAAEMEE